MRQCARLRLLVTCLLGILFLPHTALAQDTTISGLVTDTTDGVLPGATVTAVHVDSGNSFVGVSDTEGRYRIPALRPGVYTVTVELQGFATINREKLEM